MALTDKLTAIADAIRGKTGGTEGMTLDAMVSAIEGIESGGGGIEYVEGELAPQTTWVTTVYHNTGWSKYFYIAWNTALPTEDEAEYSGNVTYVAFRVYSGDVFDIGGYTSRPALSTGGQAVRGSGKYLPNGVDPTMGINLCAGVSYEFYKGAPIHWMVINLEGRYLEW